MPIADEYRTGNFFHSDPGKPFPLTQRTHGFSGFGPVNEPVPRATQSIVVEQQIAFAIESTLHVYATVEVAEYRTLETEDQGRIRICVEKEIEHKMILFRKPLPGCDKNLLHVRIERAATEPKI